MKCFGCNKTLEVGDRYIEDTASGFMKKDAAPEIDGLIADLFGGHGDKVVFCSDCTTTGGDYLPETYWGEEDSDES